MIYSMKSKKSLNKNNNDDFFGFLKQSSWDFENDFGEQITRKSYLSKKYKKLKKDFYINSYECLR